MNNPTNQYQTPHSQKQPKREMSGRKGHGLVEGGAGGKKGDVGVVVSERPHFDQLFSNQVQSTLSKQKVNHEGRFSWKSPLVIGIICAVVLIGISVPLVVALTSKPANQTSEFFLPPSFNVQSSPFQQSRDNSQKQNQQITENQKPSYFSTDDQNQYPNSMSEGQESQGQYFSSSNQDQVQDYDTFVSQMIDEQNKRMPNKPTFSNQDKRYSNSFDNSEENKYNFMRNKESRRNNDNIQAQTPLYERSDEMAETSVESSPEDGQYEGPEEVTFGWG